MPAATPKPATPKPLRFELAVSPETGCTRWRATLVARGSRVREEFNCPLELLRRITALSLGERQGGLR